MGSQAGLGAFNEGIVPYAHNLEAFLSGRRLTWRCDLTAPHRQSSTGAQKCVIACTGRQTEIGHSGVFFSITVFSPGDGKRKVDLTSLNSYAVVNDNQAEIARKRCRFDDFSPVFCGIGILNTILD